MSDEKEVSVVFSTCPPEQAERLASYLVKEGRAACVNIIPHLTSIYRWEGSLQTENEVAFILKSQPHLIKKLTARVTELHAYECPCVIAMPIIDGNPDFLKWIIDETS